MPATKRKLPQHWYHITAYTCPLCTVYEEIRERRYGPKPKDPLKRRTVVEQACNGHFL